MRHVVAVVCILLVSSATLGEESYGGFATREQLIGFWKMVPLENPKALNTIDPWPQPYQWFGFYENGRVVSMQSTKPAEHTASELDEIFSILLDKSPQYRFQDGFLVVEYPDIPSHREYWGVNIIEREFGEGETGMKVGDIMMTLAGGEDGGPVYYRHLRPVE